MFVSAADTIQLGTGGVARVQLDSSGLTMATAGDQILVESATAMVGQANLIPQSVLQLLG